jgi:hypothetical protein
VDLDRQVRRAAERELSGCSRRLLTRDLSETRGVDAYDFGDTVGLTPLMPMYTLGHNFVPPPVHAGRWLDGVRAEWWFDRRGEARATCLLLRNSGALQLSPDPPIRRARRA